jgi:hypothetical protein
VYFERYASLDVEAEKKERAEQLALFIIYSGSPDVDSGWEQTDNTEEIDEDGEVINSHLWEIE